MTVRMAGCLQLEVVDEIDGRRRRLRPQQASSAARLLMMSRMSRRSRPREQKHRGKADRHLFFESPP